jgi:hypothetical protein
MGIDTIRKFIRAMIVALRDQLRRIKKKKGEG